MNFHKAKEATIKNISPQLIHRIPNFPSVYLNRELSIDIFLPPDYDPSGGPYPVLYFNDGQQAARMRVAQTLTELQTGKKIEPIILVALYAGAERLQEYGTAATPDYAQRGGKASAYTFFIIKELLPYIEAKYATKSDRAYRAFAGFSLGGLSAFDIVWHHPDLFSKAGIFSGSFWWRSKSLKKDYTEDDRIVHHIVPAGDFHDHFRLWFSAGTAEEKEDRNNNGIIDVIDDILDLMAQLKSLGYTDDHLKYVEVQGGKHNEETWAKVLPEFLIWAYSAKS